MSTWREEWGERGSRRNGAVEEQESSEVTGSPFIVSQAYLAVAW